MTPPKSFRHKQRSYGRPKASRDQSRIFLIVTEGKKSEPNYLKSLCKHLDLAPPSVTVTHPDATDPLTLTKEAMRQRAKQAKAKKDGLGEEYDEVWVVYDLEGVHDERRKLDRQARALPKARGIRFAVSESCFEFWLLLHHKLTTTSFENCRAVVKRLKRNWRDYEKGLSPRAEFIEKTPTAVANSEKCRKHHRDSGGDGNPSTEMDFLVRSLNEATNEERQLKLPPKS